MKTLNAVSLAVFAACVWLTFLPSQPLEARDLSDGVGRPFVSGAALPFSFEEIVTYFADAFGKSPQKIDENRFAFVDRDYPDDAATITVSSLGANIEITLWAAGDYGVTRMREFFEAPFFLRSESEQLYALLDEGPGIRTAEVGRFQVQIRVSETRDWIVVAMEFRPAGNVISPG